jgi:cysteine desulfurase / selenocysteine lyase
MNISEARKLFPYLETGKIYLNHASTGPVNLRVIGVINDFLINASENEIDDFPAIMKEFSDTKKRLGEYLNCTPDRLAFLDNTTNGINVVAAGIDWKNGDHILLNDVEFPGNVYPFLNQQKKGVEVDFIKAHNGIVTAEEVIDAIKDSTRLVSISFVQFLSGYRADMKKIGEYCRSNGIIFCVDAIQGLGAVRLDVEKDKIDFLSCGTQKWMLGLQGMSFIYVSRELQRNMTPVNVGWLSVNDAWNLLDFNMSLKESAELFQTGTINSIGVFALNASLKIFEEYGYDSVEKNVLDNSEYLISRLKSIGIDPMVDEEKKYLSGIVTFRHDDAQMLYNKLEQHNIICSVREGALRIAPHFYNSREEIDNLIEVIRK